MEDETAGSKEESKEDLFDRDAFAPAPSKGSEKPEEEEEAPPENTDTEGCGSYEEACRRADAADEWAPILIERLRAEECERAYGGIKGVHLEYEEGGTTSAWLIKMAIPEHDSAADSVKVKSLDVYYEKNHCSLVRGLKDGRWYSLKTSTRPRRLGDYNEFVGLNATITGRRALVNVPQKIKDFAANLGLQAVMFSDKHVTSDAALTITFVPPPRPNETATDVEAVLVSPFQLELEKTHRTADAAVAHVAQMLRANRDVGVVGTFLVDEKIGCSEDDFYIAYLPFSRVFNDAGEPTDNSYLDVAFEFGTRSLPTTERILERALRLGEFFGMTHFLGQPSAALRKLPILPRLDDEDREALKRLMARASIARPPSPPAALRKKLTIEIPPEKLYPAGAFRQRSTSLELDLFDVVFQARRAGFIGRKRRRDDNTRTMPVPHEPPFREYVANELRNVLDGFSSFLPSFPPSFLPSFFSFVLPRNEYAHEGAC